MSDNNDIDLARLILAGKGDRSYERLSIDCGGVPTAKRLQQLATTPQREFPNAATIAGLARGLSATPTAVVMASARSLGIDVHNGDDPDGLYIGGAGKLPKYQIDALLALVRSFVKSNSETRLEAAVQAFENLRGQRALLDARIAAAVATGADDTETELLDEQEQVEKLIMKQALAIAALQAQLGISHKGFTATLREEADLADAVRADIERARGRRAGDVPAPSRLPGYKMSDGNVWTQEDYDREHEDAAGELNKDDVTLAADSHAPSAPELPEADE